MSMTEELMDAMSKARRDGYERGLTEGERAGRSRAYITALALLDSGHVLSVDEMRTHLTDLLAEVPGGIGRPTPAHGSTPHGG